MSDLKAQSAQEHERWLARKAGDRQKGKRVPRCTCSWCTDTRVNAGRGRVGRVAIRIDDDDNGSTVNSHDIEHELYMEAIRVSTGPSTGLVRKEVPLSDLIREPRSRRKGTFFSHLIFFMLTPAHS